MTQGLGALTASRAGRFVAHHDHRIADLHHGVHEAFAVRAREGVQARAFLQSLNVNAGVNAW